MYLVFLFPLAYRYLLWEIALPNYTITYIKLLSYKLQFILSYLVIQMMPKKMENKYYHSHLQKMKFLLISLNDSSKFLTKLPSHTLSLGTLKLKSNEIPNFLSVHPLTLPSCTLPPSLQLQSLHQGPFLSRSLDFLAFWFFGGLTSSLSSITTKALLLAPSPYTMKLNKGLLVFTK